MASCCLSLTLSCVMIPPRSELYQYHAACSACIVLLLIDTEQQIPDAGQQLSAGLLKDGHTLLLRSFGHCRVEETPVQPLRVSRKGGAGLTNTITHSNNVIKGVIT